MTVTRHGSPQNLRFRRRHLKPLERRLHWLIANEATDKLNSFEMAELVALENAIAELRCLLDGRPAEPDEEDN